MSSLVTLYTLLLHELYRRGDEARVYPSTESTRASSHETRRLKMQRRVLLQTFLICFLLFLVAASYAVAGFIRIPLPLTKLATIAIQACSGFTSIVYLAFNSTIRA